MPLESNLSLLLNNDKRLTNWPCSDAMEMRHFFVKSLIECGRGTMRLCSDMLEGTTLIVNLPMQKAYDSIESSIAGQQYASEHPSSQQSHSKIKLDADQQDIDISKGEPPGLVIGDGSLNNSQIEILIQTSQDTDLKSDIAALNQSK